MSCHRLRQRIRQQRKSLTRTEAEDCAEQLAQRAARHTLILQSQHIAAYLAADGEIDPWPLLQLLWGLGKNIYLPVLVPFSNGQLWFAKFNPADKLVLNRFGIPEPEQRRLIKPCALNLVLTPLVAFDGNGHRIGMGGGYYDRSFAFLRRRRHWRKPRLLGLAYELQRQASIKPNDWDIPLDAVATEAHIYQTKR
jgi:5-formyltetrahydrofolate cyclo-ligase